MRRKPRRLRVLFLYPMPVGSGPLSRTLVNRCENFNYKTTKEFYTLEDAAKIQYLINVRLGPQQIRLVIFSASNNNKIIWKGWNGAPTV